MNNPLVSIIVPTYNRPEYLRRALESIATQTHRHYEAIVVNDGGEDVAEVVNGFKKTRYINLPVNSGLPAARNAGLRVAKGDWIAYLDDDDWFYPMHLSTLLAWTNAARFIYTDADAKDIRGRVKLYMSVDPEPGNILSHNITPVCCVLHDRWLLKEAGLFDEMLPNHEDWDLWIRMSKITEMYHIKATTCCVDRTRPTMGSDVDSMLMGMLFVKRRYRKDVIRI
jgi:glycosyltransferase involved in cell wall biosynthesis